MPSLDNVPRHPTPPVELLFEQYIRPGRPVVLTDLLEGQPLRALDTLERATEHLGQMVLGVSGNFANESLAGRFPQRREMSLPDYFELVRREPATRDYCYLETPPPVLAALYEPPRLCDHRGSGDTTSLVFLGNAGNYSHLHYDEDLRDVLMFQVFGRKRYVMMAPSASHKLHPLVAPGIVRTSDVCLQHMSEGEQLAFLRYADAWDVVLQPGEALLMPFGYWHYVDYVDTALSVNFRMGRSAEVRALSALMPQPSVFMQALARHYADETRLTSGARSMLDSLLALGPAPDDELLHQEVLDAFDALCAGSWDRPHALAFAELRGQVLRQPR